MEGITYIYIYVLSTGELNWAEYLSARKAADWDDHFERSKVVLNRNPERRIPNCSELLLGIRHELLSPGTTDMYSTSCRCRCNCQSDSGMKLLRECNWHFFFRERSRVETFTVCLVFKQIMCIKHLKSKTDWLRVFFGCNKIG